MRLFRQLDMESSISENSSGNQRFWNRYQGLSYVDFIISRVRLVFNGDGFVFRLCVLLFYSRRGWILMGLRFHNLQGFPLFDQQLFVVDTRLVMRYKVQKIDTLGVNNSTIVSKDSKVF
jgi:hypothetical protein